MGEGLDALMTVVKRKRATIAVLDRLHEQIRSAQHDGLEIHTIFCSPETWSDVSTEAPGAIQGFARVFGYSVAVRSGFPVGEFFLTFTNWPLFGGRLKPLYRSIDS